MSEHRPPTMEHVADRAGVSRALVSLVMRNSPRVSAERRRAVMEAAAELGYRPNAAARNLAQRRTSTFGVVINDLHNTFFADVVDGIHEEAERHGYRLLLNAAWRTDVDEQRAIDAFLEHRVDAMILLSSRVAPDALADLARIVPLVVIGTEAVSGVDVVVNDDRGGGALAARHLLELGHTELAHIDGGAGAGAGLRRQGFVETVQAAGREPLVIGGDFTEESGYRGVERLLDLARLPTAIFAANDLVAVGALDRLGQAGVAVPGEVSVVGYDNTALAALSHIDLTTVNQPRRSIGRVAACRAVERVNGEGGATVQVLAPDLLVRGTSGPPRPDGGWSAAATEPGGPEPGGPEHGGTEHRQSRQHGEPRQRGGGPP